MNSLSEKVILLTGASRGIGAAAAIEMASRGAKLCIGARKAEDCQNIVDHIQSAGGKAIAFSCDVANYEAVEKALDVCLNEFGKIDALVNNAGTVDPISMIEESDPEAWARNISVNLVGVYNGIRAVLPHFYKQNSGTIINISSGAAHNPLEGWSAYCAGKAGVHMVTRATALEAAEKGVRVYGFAPGVVDTEMQVTIRASGINRVSQMPRTSLSPVDEPGKAIAWLCSDAAADLSGQELDIRNPDLRKRVGLPAID